MAKVVNRRQNEADNFLTYFVVLFYVIQCKHYTLQSNTAPLDSKQFDGDESGF
jgi:hypothetical protein